MSIQLSPNIHHHNRLTARLRGTLQSRLNGVCLLAFYVFPQRTSTATSVPDLSTTKLAPGLVIAADVIKMIPNVTPLTHFGIHFFKQ
jgi:hypothetical protein